MKKSDFMYGLEYKSYDESRTFDIFKTFKGAENRAKEIHKLGCQYSPLFISKAEFGTKRIYKENGAWNYDDCSDTLISGKKKILKNYN